MAIAGITLTAEITDLKELQAAVGRLFGPSEKAAILKAALEKAIEPAVSRLKQLTPVGPTGNLQRAISSKVKPYTRSGNAVALVGFKRWGKGAKASAAGGKVRAGSDRAFHQYWLEEGTGQRVISTPADKPYTRKSHTRTMKSGKVSEVREHIVARQGGYIASSYKSLGPFQIKKTARLPRGQKGQEVQTAPGSPNAFFQKSSVPIVIPPMQPGGSSGQPPLQTAWDQTKNTVAEILQRELRISLEKALDTLSQSSTGTLFLE